ncbi:MAG: SDR family NAD(P)-dependent oxidoreductase [Actinomycetota bacterium]|jgi:gluconate 5-dehydrogenase|nr:SDR family NAD(P)-dependent oxidoreductase [Actinomycetota bacterium]
MTASTDLGGVAAVVTGATSGIGEAMADALLAAGATVGFASRPTARLADAVAARRERGLAAMALPVDVRDPASVADLAVRAAGELGPVDIVVNNAGIGMRTVNPRFFDDPRPFYEVAPEGFADVVATNLTGYFLVARAFAPGFVERGRGRIVNVSMNHETMRRRGFVPYGPARAGAEALSLIMTEDLRPSGVAVNLVLPGGATATGMIPDDPPDEMRARLLPAGVMGPPTVFLASAEAEGLTGERIVATEFDRWLDAFRSGRRT